VQLTIGVNVFPGCRCNGEDGGEFHVVANDLKLQFNGEVVEITNCGEDSSSGAAIRFIEVQGVGTLKGTGKSKVNYGVVAFSAHVEDRCSANLADAVYFRAYAADNTTLLLISGDSANPLNVVPRSVSGNLVIGTTCCEEDNEGGGGEGKGHDNGEGKGKGQGNDKGQGKGNQDQGKGKGNQDQGSHDKGIGGKGKGNNNGGIKGRS
jgi:hypothetical protein